MLEVKILRLGPTQTNCYIVSCSDTLQTAVIDPAADGRNIAALLIHEGLDLTHILLTHTHFDQVGGLGQLKEEYPAVLVYTHEDALSLLAQAQMEAAFFGVKIPKFDQPDRILHNNDTVKIGNLNFQVILTSNHAPGHLSYYNHNSQILFCGDAFLPAEKEQNGSRHAETAVITKEVQEKILTLPDETQLLMSHTAPTTISDIKAEYL